jgi:hypothetical protein
MFGQRSVTGGTVGGGADVGGTVTGGTVTGGAVVGVVGGTVAGVVGGVDGQASLVNVNATGLGPPMVKPGSAVKAIDTPVAGVPVAT